MIEKLRNILKVPELRRRIIFTMAVLVVYRIGGHITTPGIDPEVLKVFFAESQSTLFGLYDMFTGGAFEKATIFALGIMPYISASIILQLLGSVFPYFQRLQREGEEGRRKLTQYSRYGTVLISALQAYGISIFLENITAPDGRPAVLHPGLGFRLMTMITMTTGTVFIMWLGEQITERGIGNGISLIIFAGIVARFPYAILMEIEQLRHGMQSIFTEVFLFLLMFATVAFVVLITQGQRKIPVQYAKRVVGRRVYGGQSTYIPMRVNTAGVIPIIFAQSIMFLPGTMQTFFPNNEVVQTLAGYFDMRSVVYWFFYALAIIFFTYFYTAVIFNPVDLADNMKKYGGLIPGIRPGRKTSEYIDRVLTRITFPGALFLAAIAIFPYFIMRALNVSYDLASFFGGTGLLIVVGVALDTLQQIESHLLMRHYEGLLRRGKIRGRRRM